MPRFITWYQAPSYSIRKGRDIGFLLSVQEFSLMKLYVRIKKWGRVGFLEE